MKLLRTIVIGSYPFPGWVAFSTRWTDHLVDQGRDALPVRRINERAPMAYSNEINFGEWIVDAGWSLS